MTHSPAIPPERSSSENSEVENEGGTMSVNGPVTGGRKGWAFGGPVADLAALGYRQEEYFLEGRQPAMGRRWYGPRDGRWHVEPV